MSNRVANVAAAAMLSLLAVGFTAPCAAQSVPPAAVEPSPYMFGDWVAERTGLARKGITFQLIYVDDVLSDTRQDLANWSRVRGTLDIDLDRAEIMRGLRFHITAMWQAGGNLGSRLGTITNPSSLASINLIRLDSWWFEKALARNKLFVRAGQFAGLDSYGVQPYGDSFINLSLGYAMVNLITATCETFAPAATPAFEIRYEPTNTFYVKSAIFSGNRNPFHDDENGVHFRFKDAPVIAAEVGYLVRSRSAFSSESHSGSYAFGATINTGPFSQIVTGQRTRTNYLLYLTANQQLYRSHVRRRSGLDVAVAMDWTPADITKTFSQITGGVRYHGLLPGRDEDTAAAGFVYSRTSGVLNRSRTKSGLAPYGTEKLLEFNYALRVNRWLTIQPVFEYYIGCGW